jgi:hypothetical protein
MKTILLSLVLFSLLIMMPMGVAAQVPDTTIETVDDMIALLATFVDWLYALLLVVAAFYLVWGGLDYVLGGGDATKIETGRNKIKYALIGVAVAVISKGLMNIVIDLLT